jgi:hypothetical protein
MFSFQIERYTNHILDEAEETLKKEDATKLSDEELNFAREYVLFMEIILFTAYKKGIPVCYMKSLIENCLGVEGFPILLLQYCNKLFYVQFCFSSFSVLSYICFE